MMGSRLLNVRLDDARVTKVRALRRTGVALSDVVREAIDARFESMVRRLTPGQAREAVTRILEAHPDPAGLPARPYDVHQGRAARRAIVTRLKRRPR
jgi:hypothetical protein